MKDSSVQKNLWEKGLEVPLLRFLKNPADLTSTQEMYHIFHTDDRFQQVAAKTLMTNEGFKKLYEEWSIPQIDLQKLAQLPENTFGYAYAKHMLKNQLDPNFIYEFQTKSVLSYLWARAKHVHDIGHLLTGFDTSLNGEISLKGFELSQYMSPSTAATTAAGLVSLSILMPEQIESHFESFMKGYRLGKEFPLLMGIRWDTEWETDYASLRARFKIPN